MLQIRYALHNRSKVSISQRFLLQEVLLELAVMLIARIFLVCQELLRVRLPRRLLVRKELLHRAVMLHARELLAADDLPKLVDVGFPRAALLGNLGMELLLE